MKHAPSTDPLESLPFRDVERILHVGRNAIGRWVRCGLLPAVKTRAGWRVLRRDLERFLTTGAKP